MWTSSLDQIVLGYDKNENKFSSSRDLSLQRAIRNRKKKNKQTKKKQNFSRRAIDHKIVCISNNLNSDFVH